MKQTLTILALCLLLSAGCSRQKSRILYPSTPPAYREELGEPIQTATWNFDDLATGRLPAGWRVAETQSTGTPASWAVVADPSAPSRPNVLAITETKNRGGTYNLALAGDTSFRDLDLTLKVKANTGQEDQGGGPLWRAKDADNYYICRFNPLESNFRLYKVVGGKRQQLATADVETKAGQWHTIRVVMKGDHIECHLDGRKLLETNDGTLPERGMIGLWTKADAATAFDDLSARPVD